MTTTTLNLVKYYSLILVTANFHWSLFSSLKLMTLMNLYTLTWWTPLQQRPGLQLCLRHREERGDVLGM